VVNRSNIRPSPGIPSESGQAGAGRRFRMDLNAMTDRTRLRLPDDLRLTDWCSIGSQLLSARDACSSWWIGDWLTFGDQHYPDHYPRAVAQTALDCQTLRNYAWVARAFPPARRRAGLSFQHHMEVAALTPSEQDYCLDLAGRWGWSRNELRRQRKARANPDRPCGAPPTVSVQLHLTEEHYSWWTESARCHNTTLQDWIVQVLNQGMREISGAGQNIPAPPDKGESGRNHATGQ
jgi:hypothetical protein